MLPAWGWKGAPPRPQTFWTQWERMRQKLNRSSGRTSSREFSQFTELEPFLAEDGVAVPALFRFEMVIPFLYDAEAERFISLRQASGESPRTTARWNTAQRVAIV
jgi:hypothetical protein